MMELTFYGAVGEVTGSCYLLKVGKQQLLIDCGLIQGQAEDEARNREPFPFKVNDIDAVVLTHAHLDHCGRLPLLAKRGYRGPIYTHSGTFDLCSIMLIDSARINEKEAEWHNLKRHRKPISPLYTTQDAEKAIRQFVTLPYDSKRDILPGVALRLRDAGHILGAAIVELWLESDAKNRKLVFSGDLGRKASPVMRNPTQIERADIVVMESTYGDENHTPWEDGWNEVASILQQAEWDHGNVLIPSFAVGRSQDLLYNLALHYDEWKVDRWKTFLDSPLAIKATEIYSRHLNLYNNHVTEFWSSSETPFMLPDLNICRFAEESMLINDYRSGALVIAGSGMCEGGRIRQHLKRNLARHNCHVIIVGYQVEGTLGRSLVDGAKSVELFGEEIEVNAAIHYIRGFSAHADQQELIHWFSSISGSPSLVLTHGEDEARNALAEKLLNKGVTPCLPQYGDKLDLSRL